MVPLIIGGVMAVGALAQLYTAEKARGAAQKRLDEIEQLYNSVKPPNYDLSINAPPELQQQAMALPQFAASKDSTQFDMSSLTPEDQKLLAKYTPQLAPYVQEQGPTTITKTADMQTGRAAQLAALRKLQEVGNSSFDPAYQEQVQQAARAAQGEAQSRGASIMQDFARRGQAGSGMQLAAQMGAASQGMDRAAMVNQSAATDAYRNRLQALMSGAQLGSQIGQEDTQFQDRNAGIINAFNERVSRNRQNYENQNANALNAAQQYNMGNEQNVANQNVQNRNQAMLANQSRQDSLAKYGADFAQRERDRTDQNAMWSYGQQDAQRKYLNTLSASQAAWNAGEKDRINNLTSKSWQDMMDINRAKTGVASMRNDTDMSAARDRNAAIQGISNAGMAGGLAYMGQQNNRANMYNQANMQNMQSTGKWMSPEEMNQYKSQYD